MVRLDARLRYLTMPALGCQGEATVRELECRE
jgi:hypothetical protein